MTALFSATSVEMIVRINVHSYGIEWMSLCGTPCSFTLSAVTFIQPFLHYYTSVHMHRRHTVVGLCICVYVSNSGFSKVAKNQVLVTAVQAQRDNISNLIVLDYWIKALFSSYGVICSPRTLLWHVPDFPEDKSARSGSPCILILESIQQLQLLTAKLCNKHAILANWI